MKDGLRKNHVNNKMQVDYTYELVRPEGDMSDLLRLYGFSPQLSPKEMLEMGVFGGKYFNDVIDTGEYPSNWWRSAKLSGLENPADPSLNFFGVLASKPLLYWEQKGWISDQDPRGWFEWYCRTYMGRRSPDDSRQVRRQIQFKRHLSQLTKHCVADDFGCRPKQRQALLQWAYDSRSY